MVVESVESTMPPPPPPHVQWWIWQNNHDCGTLQWIELRGKMVYAARRDLGGFRTFSEVFGLAFGVLGSL